MNEIALGSARTEPERQVEKALAAIPEWEGLNLTYTPVTGGLMNSNWRITVEGKPKRYFMKLPGAGSESFIDRSLANEAARRAGALDIGPEVVQFDPVTGVEVIEFLEGYRACTNGDLKRPEIPMGMIDLYRVLHSGSKLSITKTIFDMIDEHLDQVAELDVRLPRDGEVILAEYGRAKQAMLASGLDLVACHNDPMPGNILIGDGLPMKLVDYEFASNNDRAYELAVMTTEMFYGEQQTMELIEEFYGKAEWSMISRVQVCSALADVKWGLWGCMNHKLSTAWDFDYHKYGAWKLARARMKMADPRWAFWLQGL
ncbi:choline/ethanolamine kinase--aminoglycoside phosphotransferase [Rhodococcus sp. 06-412-2C]|uniref:choline/ethanolamine kinase family protein n=1 Tax=unclassified Rhodococcus (in: high G+C Gram-positive bacteria) TaxID=192944 RepID=UPI000B9BCC76|nr:MULTISPECIES: choline/ethanolamine kinase family protein [unclassified Rhodococcus (in: high G+C Gram-positive bacteria)]OZC89957.1 choline/ethanolamine kinase--aminoglycoside phosphotransferase [Rhodococcus sp. 06-412-2C]OZC93421.1 choline/ethanolamine kinase--aminoglycoside phosphotransferase [Rhodococcus sp. 06-412-2B]